MSQADSIRDYVDCPRTFRAWLAAKLAPPGCELEEVILVANSWDELARRVETRLAADEQERELLSVEIETLLKQIESLEERCARLAGLDGSAGEE
jgi:hypothetical protein